MTIEVLVSEGGRPSGIREWFGTDVIEGETLTVFERRLSRCYELAAVAFVSTSDSALLIHGSMHGPHEDNQRIAHAWLQLNEKLLWEPITACVYDAVEYSQYARLWEERRYDIHVAARLIQSSNHLGPWHESRYP